MTTAEKVQMWHPDGTKCAGHQCAWKDDGGHAIATDYAWVIEKDHLFTGEEWETDAAGICGPSNARDDLLDRVKAGEGHVFRLYDDDGELYYTGRLLTLGDMGDEEHCYAPLRDFGTGYAGATDVRWPGHREWDCG